MLRLDSLLLFLCYMYMCANMCICAGVFVHVCVCMCAHVFILMHMCASVLIHVCVSTGKPYFKTF